MIKTQDGRIVYYEVSKEGSYNTYATEIPEQLGEFLEQQLDAGELGDSLTVTVKAMSEEEWGELHDADPFDGF